MKQTSEVDTKKTGVVPETANMDPTIEELAKKHNLKPWVFSGIKAAYGWGQGKRMKENEFLKAVESWLKGPMCR